MIEANEWEENPGQRPGQADEDRENASLNKKVERRKKKKIECQELEAKMSRAKMSRAKKSRAISMIFKN